MASQYSQIIEKLGASRVKQAQSLADYTTFKIGGPADLFYEAESSDELIKAVQLAIELKVPYFILGGGSNLLIADQGFAGLVIKVSNEQILVKGNKLLVEAGVKLADLIDKTIELGLTGLEFAAGIPGSVGGAIRGNAGAWQQEIGSKVVKVQVINSNGEVVWISKDKAGFAYRQSSFKKNNQVVIAVELELEKGVPGKIRKTIETNLAKKQNQPKQPSAGCIFVNPKPRAAGALIDQCGLKGKQLGGALISPLHANFIVNTGGAKVEEVLQLIEQVQDQVKDKFGLDLEKEIFLLGFDKMDNT